jgi:hypothetical protein
MRAVAPDVAQLDAARPEHAHRRHELGHVEARGPDDAVGFVRAAVGGAQPGLGHLGDRVGDEFDVGQRQRRQVVGAEQHALAAERVAGPRPGTQLGVGQLAAHEHRRAQRQ